MSSWRESGAILLIIIIAPLFISLFLSYSYYFFRHKKILTLKVFQLNNESLIAQGWLQIILISGSLYSIIFTYISIRNREILLSSSGFKNFIYEVQLPLGILSSMALLILLISRIHNSIQTHHQIIESNRKNNFDRFISVRKYIYDDINQSIDSIISNSPILKSFNISRNLYFREAYIGSFEDGTLKPIDSFSRVITAELSSLQDCVLFVVKESDTNLILNKLQMFYLTIENSIRPLGTSLDNILNNLDRVKIVVEINSSQRITLLPNFLFSEIIYIYSGISSIFFNLIDEKNAFEPEKYKAFLNETIKKHHDVIHYLNSSGETKKIDLKIKRAFQEKTRI